MAPRRLQRASCNVENSHMRLKYVLILLGMLIGSAPAQAGEQIAGRGMIRRDAFNLKFNLTAAGPGTAEIYFHSDPKGNGYILKVSDNNVSLHKSERGDLSPLGECETGDSLRPRPAANTILIKRRKANIQVFLNGRAVVTAVDASFTRGAYAWRSSRGLSLANGMLQQVGDIYFSDDFMRETESVAKTTQRLEAHGSWTPRSGQWSVLGPGRAKTSTAVFQLCHHGMGTERGIYTAGYWFWENYIYAASVHFGDESGLAGLRFYQFDANTYFLLQWDGVSRKLKLVRASEGKRTVLAQKNIAFHPKQWYRLKVLIFGDSFRAYIDDSLMLKKRLQGAVCGGIALEARGRDVRFDDVQVLSLKCTQADFADDLSEFLKHALGAAESTEELTALFAQRPTMKGWSTSEGAWEKKNGIEWSDSVYYQGAMSWSPRQAAAGRGTVALMLSPESGDPDRGYRLLSSFDAPAGWRDTFALRNGERVGARHENKPAESLAISAADGRLKLLVGDEVLFEDSLPQTLGGFHFGRYAAGDVGSGFGVSTRQMLDYKFVRSPSDWFTTGSWQLCPRWTCRPEFNWFGGKNRRADAELWNKHRFAGDCTVEAYVAPMLMGNFPASYVFPINFRITLAADDMKPGRGYTCIYGFVDRPTEIQRNGVPVASDSSEVDATLWKDFAHARSEQVHRRWSHLKMQKKGGEIRFYVDRALRVKFTDEQPLNGPYVCISTVNNGIMVSRVKITYEKKNGKALVTR